MVEEFVNQGFELIIPLIDARRMEVYTAIFDGKSGEMISETEAKILDEILFQNYLTKILFIGDGAKKAQEIFNLPNAEFKFDIYPSAKGLIKKSVEKFDQKDFENVAYFEPFYLKDFQELKRLTELRNNNYFLEIRYNLPLSVIAYRFPSFPSKTSRNLSCWSSRVVLHQQLYCFRE
jgi:tRNA threonylcarbamoyladenosine biosynthesis protein TsaB